MRERWLLIGGVMIKGKMYLGDLSKEIKANEAEHVYRLW